MSDTLYAPPGTEEFDWPPRGRSAMGAAPRVSPLQSAMQQRQEQRDLYDPSKFVPAEGAQPLTGSPVHQPGTLGDFGRQVWASTTQMGEGLLGFVSAANRTMGGDPDMLRLIESARHAVAEHTQSVIESMSPKAQAAMRASLFGGQDRHGNATPSPNEVGWASYAGATVASAIPTVVAALLPGGVIKNAIGAGVATAGLFGAIQSGEAYNAFVTAIDNAKESDLQQSPAYQELRKTMSDTDARKELVSMIAPSLVATQFGIGAATGVGYAHMFGGGITGSLARRAGIGAAEGAALGALQGAGGNLASQRAETQAGLLPDYNPLDATLQGAAGAIGGVLLGGGAGAIAGRRRSAMKDGPARPADVPADQAAALAEIGGVQEPRPPLQGEMFLPYEMGAGPRPGEAAGMPTRQPDLFGGPEVQVTETAPPYQHPGVRMTGEPQAGMPPAQREMFPGMPEQRVPAPPNVVPPEMRQPQPEAPGQMELPLQPRATEPPPAAQEVPPEMRVRPGEIPGAPVSPIPTPASPAAAAPPAEPAPKPARAPRKRATEAAPPAARPTEQVASPQPAPSSAPAAPAPATRRPSVAPEQGASAPKAAEPAKSSPETTTVVAEAPKAEPKAEAPKPAPKIETEAPAPAKPQTTAEKLRAKRAAEKARMAATGERQRGRMESGGEEKADDAPPAPTKPVFDREAARSAVAKEVVPLKKGDDTTRAVERMLSDIEGLLSLKTQDGAPVHHSLQGALREWVRKQPDRLPGTKTRPGDLADKISRAVEGKALTDTAENRAAARQEARQPSVVEDQRITKKAAAEEAVGDNVAADNTAATGEGFDESVERRRAEAKEAKKNEARGAEADKIAEKQEAEAKKAAETEQAGAEDVDASVGVQDYHPELARERAEGSNKSRVAADLLYEMRQGLKSPEEAAIEYGGPAETGRKRNNATFVDYLEKQIAHYGDPKTVEAVMRDLAAAEKKRLANKGDAKSKQDDSNAVQRLLREYEMTSADSLDMLRAAATKLRDADTEAGVKAEIAAKQAEKKAEKKALADEAKQVGVSAATMQKLRRMVSTAERQAATKAVFALQEHRQRTNYSMTDLAKQLGYDPQRWIEEHQLRQQGHGTPDAERSAMYDAVQDASLRRQLDLQEERLVIMKRFGVKSDQIAKAEELLDAIDPKDSEKTRGWLAENYGTPEISRSIAPLLALAEGGDLSVNTNRLISEINRSRVGLHEMLDGIMNDEKIQEKAPGLARLAKLLRKKVPDLDVIGQSEAERRYDLFPNELSIANGAYIWSRKDGGAVMMRWDATSHITAVHEALHAATQHFVNNNRKSPEVLALERIRSELAGMELFTFMNNSKGGKLGRLQYAMTDAHETLALMMTDPSVQGFMAKTRASRQFIEDMRALGIDPTVGRPSMWNVFVDWVKKIVGIDPHKDGVMMLDYAMRTGLRTIKAAEEWNSITPEVWRGRGDTAIAANKINRNIVTPDDPVGRELATTARGAVNRAVTATDLASMGDKARAAVLQAATTDAIVKWNEKLAQPSDRLGVKGNPLVRLRDALENITGVARRYHEEHGDTVSALADRLRSKAGQEVASLMNDATLAEVRLGTTDEAANAHLKTPEQQARLAELRDRYDALSDEAKQLYKDTRTYYETTYRAERKARLGALVDAVMPGATEEQRKAILSALRTRAGTEALLTDKSTGVEAAFGNDWQAHRALVRGVAKVHKMGFVSGDYFPLRRFGDYVVRYGSGEEGNYGVEMFERRSEAEARRAELAAQGVDDLSQVMDRRESQLRDLLPGSSIPDEIERAVAKNPRLRDQAGAIREVIDQVLLEHATRSERVKTQFRRKGVQGATVDPARVLAAEYLAAGYRMGHIQHGFERGRALADLQLVVDDLGRHGAAGEQIRLSQVKKELEQRVATGDDAGTVLAGAARRATQLGYVQSLMSPSHMVTNTVGAWANAVPLIGARHGAGAASVQLAKASAQVAPKVLGQGVKNFLNALGKGLKAADWRMSHLARDRFIAAGASKEHMTKLFETLDHVGLIDHTQDRELQNIANPTRLSTTGVGKLWQRFMDLNAAGAHAVDVMNKSAIAKAAFDLEFRKTGDAQTSIDYAMETLRQAHPNYNLSNRSRIATNKGSLGQAGAPLMQFKAYGFHMYGVLANLTKQSMHGATTEQRREARLALAGIIATHAAAAGVVNTIADPLRYIGGAYDFVTNTRPRDYQADVRNFIADIFGPELGEVISRGVPRAAGIDLSNRVGLGNMLAVPELTSFDAKGVVNMVGLAALGAGGQDASEIGMGLGAMLRGDVTEGLKLMAPRVLRDAMKAAKLAGKGVVTPRGQVIIPAEQLTMKDILSQAVGFQPARVAEAREARNAVSSRMMEARERRTKLANKWLEADPADRSGLMDNIREWNQANPGFTLTVAQLLQMQKDRGKAAKTDYGLRVPPKARALRENARFANVER